MNRDNQNNNNQNIDNLASQKSIVDHVFSFLFTLLIYYTIGKLNRPGRKTFLIVMLFSLALIYMTMDLPNPQNLGFSGLSFVLMAWVSYRYYRPMPIKPSPIQQLQSALSKLKQAGLDNIKAAEQEGVPLEEYMVRQYDLKHPTPGLVQPNSTLNTSSMGLLCLSTLLCLVFAIISASELKQEWRLNHVFLETQCQIADKTVTTSTGTKDEKLYKAKVKVNYQVGKQVMSEWISVYPYGARYETTYQARQEAVMFHEGEIYTCWYDPRNIRSVSLAKGYSLFSFIQFAICSALFFILLYTIVRYKLLKKT